MLNGQGFQFLVQSGELFREVGHGGGKDSRTSRGRERAYPPKLEAERGESCGRGPELAGHLFQETFIGFSQEAKGQVKVVGRNPPGPRHPLPKLSGECTHRRTDFVRYVDRDEGTHGPDLGTRVLDQA